MITGHSRTTRWTVKWGIITNTIQASHTPREGGRKRETERETERDTERETKGQREREIDRQRETDRDRDRGREREYHIYILIMEKHRGYSTPPGGQTVVRIRIRSPHPDPVL